MRKILLAILVVSPLARAASPVLVIDEGADLAHPKLAGRLNMNAAEQAGQSGKDDDNDGFVDNTLGWNQPSNDKNYMPPGLLEVFQQNKQVLVQLFDLYTRVENDDPQAIAKLRQLKAQNPKTYEALNYLLGKAHGTHVAGIVAANSVETARLQSLNVLTESTEGTQRSRPQTVRSLLRYLRAQQESAPAETATEFRFSDFLKDKKQVADYLAQQEQEEKAAAQLITKYVRASHSRVANLSLGSSVSQIRKSLNELWQAENTRLGRPVDTARDADQEANFQALVNGLYKGAETCWNTVIAANPDVLFVVAAGNYEEDNDAVAISPANASVNNPNVITVAATDKNGVITDFSNFGARSVNIGAWGKAVPSLAPAGLEVSMSGTSMSSPLVAGVATKVRDLNPKLTAAQVRQLLERTGRQVGSLQGKTTSGAMIDPTAAFAAATSASGFSSLLLGSLWAPLSPQERLFEGGLSFRDGTEGVVSRTNEAVRDLLGLR
jgi:subtilisin family serine protease